MVLECIKHSKPMGVVSAVHLPTDMPHGTPSHGGLIDLHPGGLTWSLQITHVERNMIFENSIIMFQPLVFRGVPFIAYRNGPPKN